MSKDLKILKLVTGEEIIAELVGESSEYQFYIKNALVLAMQQTEKGIGVAIFPWGNNVKDEYLVIDAENVIYSGSPRKELEEMYHKAFSPLALPQKSLITE
jgi:hypothetical protein